jgi:hypothetical protein
MGGKAQLNRVSMQQMQEEFWWSDGWGSADPLFTSIRPWLGREAPKDSTADSTFLRFGSGKSTVALSIPLDMYGALSMRPPLDLPYRAGSGLSADLSLGSKWHVSGFVAPQLNNLPDWLISYRGMGINPGFGLQKPADIFSLAWGGSVRYRPSRYFVLEAGKDRHFLGDGQRSLLLSDYAPEYPYGMITAQVWRLRYICLYSFMQDRYPDPYQRSDRFPKNATTHYLAINLGNKFEAGVFESIIFQGKDTMVRRGYDIAYLNPIIFFRPVEYGLGSADNALMGLNLRYTPVKGLSFYGQFVLDEFFLKEIRADLKHAFNKNDTTLTYGWWANKYGFQVGFKLRDPFGLQGLRAAAEINVVRPYTYAHGAVPQNYAHQNHPLAHPLGANFRELIMLCEYDWKGFTFSSRWVIYEYGSDSGGTNFGGNIFLNYSSRPGEYYHTIGQGFENHVTRHELTVRRMIYPAAGLQAFATWIYRLNNSSGGDIVSNYLMVGIRTPFRRQVNDL